MLIAKPVFPGNSTLNQLEKICEVIGKPTEKEIKEINSPFAATMLDSISDPKVITDWRTTLSKTPNVASSPQFGDALDLLDNLMQFDPTRRMMAANGLQHPYCKQFHDPDTEKDSVAKKSVDICLDDNEKKNTSVYREKLYNEITRMKKDGHRKR